MIIDSSAVVFILGVEDDATAFATVVEWAACGQFSPAPLAEALEG